MTIWWALPLGLLVGLTMGALGGGGAILAVPALVYLLGLDAHAATTASLVIVLMISLTGVWPHHARGHVRWRQGAVFGALGVLGSWLGTRLSTGLDDRVLQLAFALLLVVVASLMLRRLRGTGGGAAGAAGTPAAPARPRGGWPLLVATATGVGLLTGFFGVGGGFAVVPALSLVLGFDMAAAVGTSILVIGVNTATALLWRVVGGHAATLDWPVVGLFAAAAVLGGLAGGRLATRLRPRTLQAAFAALLAVLAAFMLVQSVRALLG